MPERILLFQFGDLGDTLLTVPAMRAIRQRYPDARIGLVCKEIGARVVRDLALVDDVLLVDKHLFDRPRDLLRPAAFRSVLATVLRVRSYKADHAVLFHHLVTRWGALKFALLTLATGAGERVGLDNGRGWFLTRAVRDRGFGVQHEAAYWMDVAALLGAKGTMRLEFAVTDADRARASELLPEMDGIPLVVIHPGAGWYGPGRRWPAEQFAAAARLLMQRWPGRVVLVGTAEDTAAAAAVASAVDGSINLCGQTDLGTLAAVLERCRLLIANDAGVGHVAASVQTPVLSIFGPSNDRAWRPLTATVLAADLPCRPCFYRDFERGLPNGCATRECMALISPRLVAETALQILGAAHE